MKRLCRRAHRRDDLSPSGYGSDSLLLSKNPMAQSGHSRNLFHRSVQMLRHGVGRWDISGGGLKR